MMIVESAKDVNVEILGRKVTAQRAHYSRQSETRLARAVRILSSADGAHNVLQPCILIAKRSISWHFRYHAELRLSQCTCE